MTNTGLRRKQISQGRGQAHGKVILLGEHAVVYGYPAVSVPLLSAVVQVQVTQTDGKDLLSCAYYRGKLTDAPMAVMGYKRLIEKTRETLPLISEGLTISVSSTIPPGYGLGSSAAVAVAIVRGLYDFCRHRLTHEQLLKLVHIAETYAHGNPSGVDAWTTSTNRPLWFIHDREPIWLSLRRPLYLVVAGSRAPGNTHDAVQHVQDTLARRVYLHPMEQLAKLTEDARWALIQGDYRRLGLLMTAAQYHLERLGITTDHIDALIAVALASGALGAKLTGSGDGGSIIALVADRDDQGRLAAALTRAGAVQVWTPVLGEDT